VRPAGTSTTAVPPSAGPAAGRPAGRSVWRGIGRSAGARLMVLPVSALLGIVVTRVVVEEYGTASFAQYGLLVGIATLLPFADLGMAAAVMNGVATSDDPARDARVRGVLVSAMRVLLASGAVICLVAVLLTLAGAWPALLGDALLPGSGPVAAMLCLLVVGLTLPLGIGQRVLSAQGRNHQSILLLGLQTPVVLAAVLLLVHLGAPVGGGVAVIPYVVTLLLSGVCTVLALRSLRPAATDALRLVPRVRSVRGEPVFHLAWPMLVQMIALPIAMQTDRIVLSHRVGTDGVAQYNLASQMFTPVWAVVSAAGVTLWPVFAKARAQGRTTSPFPIAAAFGAAGLVVSLVVAAASGWLADLASGGRIALPTGLVVAFVALMALQAFKYPLGMYMTDARGLRAQAAFIVAALPVNVALSWWLAGELGPAGPVVGSVVGVGLSQVVCSALYVRHRLRTDARAAAA